MTSTTTTLISSLNPCIACDTVTFSVSVVSNDILVPGPPTGTVILYDGITSLGFQFLDGSGNCAFNINGLSVAGSPHDITAVYSGDGTFDPSTSNDVFQVVNQATPSLTLVASASGVVWNKPPVESPKQVITFTATVVNGCNPTGTVHFLIDGVEVSTGTVSSDVCTFSTNMTGYDLGNHTVSASYDGDANNAAATAPDIVTVVLPNVSVRFAANPVTDISGYYNAPDWLVVSWPNTNPSEFGEPVKILAWLQSSISVSGNVIFPTGTMTLKNGSDVVATATLIQGDGHDPRYSYVEFTVTTLPIGTNLLTVEYGGLIVGGNTYFTSSSTDGYITGIHHEDGTPQVVTPTSGGGGPPQPLPPPPPPSPGQPEVAPVPPQEFRRCPDKITCPGTDSPVLNLSSEAVDFPNFFSIYFGQFTPDLGTDFGTDGCASVATSPDSLESANLQAAVDSLFCVTGTWTPPTFPPPPGPPIFPPPIIPPPPPPPLPDPVPPPPGYFGNTAQTATQTCINGQSVSFTVPADTFTAPTQAEADAIALDYAKAYCEVQALATCSDGIQPPPPPPPTPQIFLSGVVTADYVCPDGNAFSFTVQPGKFAALSQVLADRMAYSWALQQAFLHRICLSAIDPNVCLGAAATITIQASGGFLDAHFNDWEIVAGAVPPGMTFNGGFHGTSVTITGTPTVAGAYSFTVKVTAPNGDFMAKAYSLCVTEIQPASLPPATPNVAYLQDLTLNCGGTPSAWFLTSGTLPPGITLDGETGALSGTPTVAGSYTFTIAVQLP